MHIRLPDATIHTVTEWLSRDFEIHQLKQMKKSSLKFKIKLQEESDQEKDQFVIGSNFRAASELEIQLTVCSYVVF